MARGKGDFGVHVEGLDSALRALDEFGGEAPGRVRAEMRQVAEQGSNMAAFIAASRGDVYAGAGDHGDPARRDGDLVAKISVRLAGRDRFAVTEFSRTRTKKYPGGYPYPRRIEFGLPGRAFMGPMAKRMEPIARERLTGTIDALIAEKGLE
jgi:hypothetical protein